MIIDSHVHFYDPSRPQGVPWPRKSDTSLYKIVLPEHFKAISIPEGITGVVVVEASEWLEDNQWILDLAAKEPFIVGFVGNLRPGTPDFARNLERFSLNPLFRGIRRGGAFMKNQIAPDTFCDLEKLASKDLALDLLIKPEALPAVALLAKSIPSLRIVINHTAEVHITGSAPDPNWMEGMKKCAEYPNIYAKVSSLASDTRQIPAPTDVAFYAPTLNFLWETFGENHLIFGSNWPVCSIYAELPDVLRVVKTYMANKGKTATEKFFWKNSQNAYKWTSR